MQSCVRIRIISWGTQQVLWTNVYLQKKKQRDFHGTARKCITDSVQKGHLSQQTHIDKDLAQKQQESGRVKSYGTRSPQSVPSPASSCIILITP